jgi:membrane-bound ClpP family serine protease
MDKRNLAFGKMNFILLAIGVAVIILGFLLMSGAGTTEETFNPEIFSAMKIKVAPVVTFLGFVSIIVAIIYKPKDGQNSEDAGK